MSAHYHSSPSYSSSSWPQVPPPQTPVSLSNQGSPHYGSSHFPNDTPSYQYDNYPPLPSHQRMSSLPISPTGSNELMLSPLSGSQLSPHMTPPHTPGSQTLTPSPTAEDSSPSSLLFTPMQVSFLYDFIFTLEVYGIGYVPEHSRE